MTTTTHSHKAWTDKGGHVTSLTRARISGRVSSDRQLSHCNAILEANLKRKEGV